MSGDSGGAAIGAIVVFFFVLYLIAMVVAVAAIIAMVVLGFLSVWVSKSSGKTLVPQEDIILAAISSAAWAGALAVGCMIGSVGLVAALDVSLGSTFSQALSNRYQFGPNNSLNAIVLYDWIIRDSLSFAFHLGLTLFVGNRIYVARKRGGWALLGVIPPLFAMSLAFFIEHRDTIINFVLYLEKNDLSAIRSALIEEFVQPFEMLLRVFLDPNETLSWARGVLLDSAGSFFRLATYLPWIFLIVSVAFMMRHTVGGDAGADS